MGKKIKSYLDVAFGAYLQEERKSMPNPLNVEEICQKTNLNMSPSLYKMMEAGFASLNSVRIFDLIKVFSHSNIRFERLAKFIAIQNYVESLITSNGYSPQEAFKEVADMDSEISDLYNKFIPLFSLEDSSYEQKNYTQTNLVNEIRDFLQNKYYPISDEKKFKGELINKINFLPSLNLEILNSIIESFAKIHPQHYGTIAAEWEKLNKSIFIKVEGYFSDIKYIIDENNLSIFKYLFLENNHFELNFIFNSHENPNELKERFIELLSRDRTPQITEDVRKKIHFKIVRDGKKKSRYENLLKEPNSEKCLDAFWVFTTINKNKIGFVGVNAKDINRVFNLTYQDTLLRTNVFEKLWNNLSHK